MSQAYQKCRLDETVSSLGTTTRAREVCAVHANLQVIGGEVHGR